MNGMVQIYRNLHKKGVVYSVRSLATRKVVDYVSDVVLTDVVFKVNQSGRERVVREKRKNVHAVMEGRIISDLPVSSGRLITYNPYKSNQFVLKNNPTVKVFEAKRVNIINGKIMGIGIVSMER
jgi:hypothetical protein